MATLFPIHVFEGFGPTTVRPVDFQPLLGRIRSHQEKRLRAGVQADAPKQPGVYGMLGKHGDLIYIGKAKSLRARLMSYFRDSRDPKAGRILRQTYTLVWETVCDEFAALARELELIRRHRPRFNVLGQPGRQKYCYLCLGKTPAACAYVTRSPSMKDIAVYGPLVSPGRAKAAARRLNDWYRLRDCPQTQKMHFAEQRELFPLDRTPGCLRFDIGTCSGPCVGECTRTGYGAQVRGAKAFLEGNDARPLEKIRHEMAQAAKAFEFERAAAMRDRLNDLEWLRDRMHWLRQARQENTFVYPLQGTQSRPVWYLIHRGRVVASCYQPMTTDAAQAHALLADVYKDATGPVLPPGQVDHVLLVSAWFRKYPEQKGSLLTPVQAMQMCLQLQYATTIS